MVWAAIYTTVAYLAGNWLKRTSGTIAWILGGLAVVAIIALVLVVRREAGRLADRAERAYPGTAGGLARGQLATGRYSRR